MANGTLTTVVRIGNKTGSVVPGGVDADTVGAAPGVGVTAGVGVMPGVDTTGVGVTPGVGVTTGVATTGVGTGQTVILFVSSVTAPLRA
ncbi:MAG: hypothetical protein JWP21_1403, partial [Tardiphaga sp.]|nr:hypothetical protein [Tardiphaga sp.]